MDCSVKFVFHLPRFRVEDGRLVAIDFMDFRKDLTASLRAAGAAYILSEMKNLVLGEHEPAIELMTAYCAEEDRQALQEVFFEKITIHRSDLGLDKYFYEMDDVNIVVSIGNSKLVQ